jgi:hypothetical protein
LRTPLVCCRWQFEDETRPASHAGLAADLPRVAFSDLSNQGESRVGSVASDDLEISRFEKLGEHLRKGLVVVDDQCSRSQNVASSWMTRVDLDRLGL